MNGRALGRGNSAMFCGMNRVERAFASLSDGGRRRAVMPFVTAGDPDLATTGAVLHALDEAGATVCEVGVPFSDPIADGPTIQASMTRALEGGVRVPAVFDTVERCRAAGLELPLVAMVSYSIVHRMGLERFVAAAAGAGFDGFIFPDLPVEEADAVAEAVRGAGMILSMLIAPTTPIKRATRIAAASSGFVYVLARAGITGERSDLPEDLGDRLAALREATDLPLAVGFGISTPEQVAQVTAVADAAIVGSAVVRCLHDAAESHPGEPERVAAAVGAMVRAMVGGR